MTEPSSLNGSGTPKRTAPYRLAEQRPDESLHDCFLRRHDEMRLEIAFLTAVAHEKVAMIEVNGLLASQRLRRFMFVQGIVAALIASLLASDLGLAGIALFLATSLWGIAAGNLLLSAAPVVGECARSLISRWRK